MLKAEFEAVKKVHDMGFSNIGIMLPFVSKADEVRKAKGFIEEIFKDEYVELGVSAETPACAWIIDDICRLGIDFVSISAEGLAQHTLAVDRESAIAGKHYDELHAAVMSQIAMIISKCKRFHVHSSIYGETCSKPKMAAFLVRQGIDSISAMPEDIAGIRKIVAATEKKLLLDAERRILRIRH